MMSVATLVWDETRQKFVGHSYGEDIMLSADVRTALRQQLLDDGWTPAAAELGCDAAGNYCPGIDGVERFA
jgi:hypothetical protein